MNTEFWLGKQRKGTAWETFHRLLHFERYLYTRSLSIMSAEEEVTLST